MIIKSVFNKFIIVVVIFFLLVPLVFASNEVDISADELEYDELGGRVIARGHVILNWDNKKVFTDYVEFLINKKSMIASGNVNVEENGYIIHSESIVYNYDDETGQIKEIFVSSSNKLYIHSKSIDMLSKDTFNLKHVTFSNCDLDEPHSSFKSNRGKLVLNKRITIYNAVFYIGKIPVFYLPFVTKSLKGGWGFGSHLKLAIEPCYTDTGSFSVKTTVSCALSGSSVAKVKYDCFEKRGKGYGGEFNCVTNGGILNICAYTIKDLLDKKKRWAFKPNYFQKLNNTWTLRSSAELMSDNNFNNFYSQSDWNRTTNYLKSYVSLTRQGEKTSLEINFKRTSKYNEETSKYEVESINFPKVSWTYYKSNLGCGIMHKSSFEYSNTYKKYDSRTDAFYKSTAVLDYNLTKSFRMLKRFILMPGLDVSENWYDRSDKNELKNAFFIRYGGTFNTRFIVTSWMNWNARYTVLARTKTSSLDIDTDLQNYGIEANNIKFSNYMYIGDRMQLSNSMTYNLMRDRKNIPKNFGSLLISDLAWTPKYYITVYAKETQQLEPSFKFRSLQIDIRTGELTTSYFNFGMFYQHYDDPKKVCRNNKINNIIGFGLWLNPKWRFDYNIRSTIAINVMYSRLNEHELRIYRDCHCYNFGIRYRKRINEWNFDLMFNMKTNINMAFIKNSNNLGYNDNDNPRKIFYSWRDYWDSSMS
jgi:LPS-assembly protein